MGKKEKPSTWFRVATEGATTDGRVIQREWLTGAAAAYNPEVYGARINCEHIKGFAPMFDPKTAPFGSYGDVVALKAEEITDGPLKGRMGLYAQLAPTDELIALNKKSQKVYTSIEIDPDFSDTKTPYLLGMAVTDNPASLGTSYLQFCAQHPNANPLAARHTTATALFTAAEEIALVFADNEQHDDDHENGSQFFSRISAMLFSSTKKQERNTTELQNAIEVIARSQADVLDRMEDFSTQQALDALTQQLSSLTQDYNALKTQLEQQPEHFTTRPPSTGNNPTANTVDY